MTKRPGGPVSTITTPEDQRPPTIGIDPIVVLWVPQVPAEVTLPYDLAFMAGRSPDCAAMINHPSVSRLHAAIERWDNRLRVKNHSKNVIEYRGARVDDFVISAGERMKLAEVEAFALTRSMVAARRELAYCLGYAREARVMELIADAAASRSFAIVGPPGTPRYEVASALVQASPRRDGRRRDVLRDQVPRGEDAIREMVSRNAGGVVCIDGDILDALDKADRGTLLRQVTDPKWNLTVLWTQLHGGGDAPPEIAMLRERIPSLVTIEIAAIANRPRRELPTMLDHVFAAMGVGLNSYDIDRDNTGRNLKALKDYAWPENHHELRMCAGYIAHAMHGAGVESIAEMLGASLDGKPLTRKRLRTLVDKWGINVRRSP